MRQVLTLPVGFHEIIVPVLKANPYTIFYDGFLLFQYFCLTMVIAHATAIKHNSSDIVLLGSKENV
jgi:hypothetical protein